jgi:DnaJ-class molecular chaperone
VDEIPIWELCVICNGQGEVECMLCKGNGRKWGGFLGDIDLGVCDECHGSGVLVCRSCHGTGLRDR